MKKFKTQLREMKKASYSKLRNAVITDILSYSNDENDIISHCNDILQYGCQSGTVGQLIYYTDTTKFFKKHKSDILAILKNSLFETGFNSPIELFGLKWDESDIFCEETQNQNLLAWFGYEETLRYIMIETNRY